MSIYAYRATTMDGALLEGVIEAPDEESAVNIIKNKGLILLHVSATQKDAVKERRSLRSSRTDLLTFTTELSALLGAGLPLDRSLNVLSDISESSGMRDIIQAILKAIREGSSFSEALQRQPEVFPRIYVNMVRAGESGGVLDVILDKLNEFLETTQELKDSVLSAMIYPTILSITGGMSIIVLLTFVLPKFSGIFQEVGTALPLPTQVLLAVSAGLKSYWWIALCLTAIVWITLRKWTKTPQGRYGWDSIKLKLMGDLITKLETARFCRTLGTLIKSGVPLLQALNNTKDIIGNQVIASSINSVFQGIKEGKGIAGPLAQAAVLPPLAMSMIKVGEETGQLDVMLLKVATTYEKGLRISIKRFMGFIEPAMILIMGLLIGFIVLSMLMAIFSITELPF